MPTRNKAKMGRKKAAAMALADVEEKTTLERKLYVLQNIGTKTYAEIADHLGISEVMIYKYLTTIRGERKKLGSEVLTQDKCDEQLNRRGTMVLECWNQYFEAKRRLEELKTILEANKLDGKEMTMEQVKVALAMFEDAREDVRAAKFDYDRQEHGLTHLLKAIGVYAPDIMLQQNNIQVLNLDAEKALKDVRDKFGNEMAEELEKRMKERAIEIKAREVNERPTSGQGRGRAQTGKAEGNEGKTEAGSGGSAPGTGGPSDPGAAGAPSRAAELGAKTFAQGRKSGGDGRPGQGRGK